MLSRDQQNLLGALGSAMAADALLDRLRERGTLEGGRSAPQEGCWLNYNRKAVWLEGHSGLYEAMKEAGTDKDAWRRIRPRVVLKATWAEVAAYGATLPQELRTELDRMRRTESEENRSWSEFSDARGGWPWRRRFDSNEEHQEAQAERDEVYGKHLVALRDVWDRQKAAISRALPLTVDDEPVDLLELLDQQPATPAAPTHSAAAGRRVTGRYHRSVADGGTERRTLHPPGPRSDRRPLNTTAPKSVGVSVRSNQRRPWEGASRSPLLGHSDAQYDLVLRSYPHVLWCS